MITQDIQKLELDAKVDMFIFDLNPIGQPVVYRYYPGVDANYGDLVYQTHAYAPWPISLDGLKKSGSGPQNRPVLTISNTTKLISINMSFYQDFVGAKVTRLRTLARYLDNGVSPDPTAFQTEIYYVDRKKSENKMSVQFELATPIDFLNKQLPGRAMVASTCGWLYKSKECSWPGTDASKYFDVDGNPVATPAEDVCGQQLTDCKLRFGAGAELPFGGFPSLGRR